MIRAASGPGSGFDAGAPEAHSEHRDKSMKRFLIERYIPGVGALSDAQLRDIAAASNLAVAKLSGRVQWIESRIAANNTFCLYFAEDPEVLREHSRLAGFPITKINEIVNVIDPLTAYRPLVARAEVPLGVRSGAV
jgi:hypothetical protein